MSKKIAMNISTCLGILEFEFVDKFIKNKIKKKNINLISPHDKRVLKRKKKKKKKKRFDNYHCFHLPKKFKVNLLLC